jgi:hypothetical protein
LSFSAGGIWAGSGTKGVGKVGAVVWLVWSRAHDKFQEVTQKPFIPNPENIYEDIYSHMKDKII